VCPETSCSPNPLPARPTEAEYISLQTHRLRNGHSMIIRGSYNEGSAQGPDSKALSTSSRDQLLRLASLPVRELNCIPHFH
jgi:hypothetical protein